MKQSIKTIQLLKSTPGDREANIKKQMLAGTIRIAEIMSNMGNRDQACRIIDDLAGQYLNNDRVSKARENLRCK